MITKELLDPKSIVIVGASNDVSKPGGKVLKNIIDHGFSGKLFAVNPKEKIVQGVECFSACENLPQVDLAIIAVSAQYVEANIRVLALQKGCKGFILFSAGFSEIGDEGIALEKRCVEIINSVGGSLIGPNCIGVITEKYKGVFAGPIPQFDPMGCDCVSASGATMVFILEAAIPRGLKFRNIFSIGNSAQIGVEDILEYWDNEFDATTSSKIKLLYLEQVSDPKRFLKHARSLVKKGCRIAAIKSGSTEAGSRAVSSHTGSLAGSNTAVSSLFRKAGVVRCYSRVELVYVAAIFAHKQLRGDRIAVITHAGGPGVMLTDVLIKGGLKVPKIEGKKADELLSKLYPGSSVSNPIDFLATGTAQHLGHILDAVDNDFDHIDGSVVVFGTTGMWSVDDVYEVLHEKMKTSKKPIFPILPSVIQAADEVSHFHSMGHVNFTDEVSFGYVLSRVYKTSKPYDESELVEVDKKRIRGIIDASDDGYLSPSTVAELLDAAGIKRVQEFTATNLSDALKHAEILGFPLVMKVVGPVHKSDVGGVKLNVTQIYEVKQLFSELMKIKDATSVLLQQQKSGTEVFIGAKDEEKFGHQIVCGLGGIFIEVFKDVSFAIAPVGKEEAKDMISHLKSYPIIKGVRGREGVNEEMLIETLLKLSALLAAAPEIKELDINPLLGSKNDLVAVDARVNIVY
ncbi:MAG: acetate--CoA ligase family protein [Bacteroidota bacterium]